MKLINMVLAVLLVFLLVGCSSEKSVQVGDTNEEVTNPVEDLPQENLADVPVVDAPIEEKSPEEICQEKAIALIPKNFNLSIASNHDPNSDGWSFESEVKWEDGTAMDTKGDIDFRKGSIQGENADHWYTRNTQNEKLFGVGGLKYFKKVMDDKGIPFNNEFIVKLTLKPVKKITPPKSFEPYMGTFGVVDYEFSRCSFN